MAQHLTAYKSCADQQHPKKQVRLLIPPNPRTELSSTRAAPSHDDDPGAIGSEMRNIPPKNGRRMPANTLPSLQSLRWRGLGFQTLRLLSGKFPSKKKKLLKNQRSCRSSMPTARRGSLLRVSRVQKSCENGSAMEDVLAREGGKRL